MGTAYGGVLGNPQGFDEIHRYHAIGHLELKDSH
jgi:hypothetical protein